MSLISLFSIKLEYFHFKAKTKNKKITNFKEEVDKTLHYFIAICNIKAVRDHKKNRYVSLFQVLCIDVFNVIRFITNISNELKFKE